jgi:hypothetical protein
MERIRLSEASPAANVIYDNFAVALASLDQQNARARGAQGNDDQVRCFYLLKSLIERHKTANALLTMKRTKSKYFQTTKPVC